MRSQGAPAYYSGSMNSEGVPRSAVTGTSLIRNRPPSEFNGGEEPPQRELWMLRVGFFLSGFFSSSKNIRSRSRAGSRSCLQAYSKMSWRFLGLTGTDVRGCFTHMLDLKKGRSWVQGSVICLSQFGLTDWVRPKLVSPDSFPVQS